MCRASQIRWTRTVQDCKVTGKLDFIYSVWNHFCRLLLIKSSSLKSPPKPMGLLRTRIEPFHQRTFALARERLGIPCQNTACAVTCYRERASIVDIFGNLAFRRAVENDGLFGIVRFYNSSGWKRWVEFTHFNGDLRLDSFWATQY